ncbi:YlzJ-like family protein [Paenibacillus aquistagni]|uniref:YlzJ-like protein n=1 Tax=Paenibacillus aquistagni TaxID=1852522 RepID=A0A1X7IPK0_9BACL|nr:YlzJ-like family protein [Paenibacillus aquistagni]SMG16974.1 YlzJ-like protein [Paenibacillus aquistagni]
MLYSILPMEVVLEGNDTFSPMHMEMKRNGRTLLVEQVSPQEMRIERLVLGMSIDDYLDPAYQPGTLIPVFEINQNE